MKFVGMVYTDNGDLVATMNAKSKDVVNPYSKNYDNKIKFEEISIYERDARIIIELYKKITETI